MLPDKAAIWNFISMNEAISVQAKSLHTDSISRVSTDFHTKSGHTTCFTNFLPEQQWRNETVSTWRIHLIMRSLRHQGATVFQQARSVMTPLLWRICVPP